MQLADDLAAEPREALDVVGGVHEMRVRVEVLALGRNLAGIVEDDRDAGCRRHDAVVNAQAAGALAVVTSYAEWPRDGVLRPTLIEPNDIKIPVLGATKALGDALADAAAAGSDVHLTVQTTSEVRRSVNVIAETPAGDPNHVVMIGGHLDSVVDGPGLTTTAPAR